MRRALIALMVLVVPAAAESRGAGALVGDWRLVSAVEPDVPARAPRR